MTPLRSFTRAVAAAVLLLVALAGAPLLLAVIAPLGWPTAVPTWETVTAALVRPDDGALLIAALRLAAWACWATFTVTTLVDLVARLRHTDVPNLPMLGWLQRTSAGLVATAGLLLSATHAAAATAASDVSVAEVLVTNPDASTAAPAAALLSGPVDVAMTGRTGSMTQRLGAMTAVDPRAGSSGTAMTRPRDAMTPPAQVPPAGALGTVIPFAADGADERPIVIVERGDSLWRLAERHLGDGARFEEIAALNRGVTQPDGRTLSDEHWIYPGWRLRLPVDATDLTPAPAAGNGTLSYTVEPGDTLWDIAATHLGDGDRYPEIVELNQGVTQPDGATLDDPDLVRPGWTLALPVADPVPRAAAEAIPATTSEPAPRPDDRVTTPPVVPAQPELSDSTPAVVPAPAPVPGATSTPAPAADQETAPPTEDTAETTPSVQTEFPGPLLAGLTVLAAAGVTGELARRRHLRHLRRRTGERLPMPAAGTPTAETERTLRRTQTPLSIAQLRAALAHLASTARATGQDQPPLVALVLARDTLTAHLTEPIDPPAPWTATSPTTWQATVADLADLDSPDDPDAPEPYPALVTVGHTADAVVLVNLEAAGTFTVVGTDELTAPVLRAMVAELVTSELTGRIGLATGRTFAPLAAVCDASRLQVVDGPPGADHPGRTRQVRAALAETGADDTLQARSDRIADDTWLPVVYVATPDDPAPTRPAEPWSGSVLLTADTEAAGDWHLEVTDLATGTLQPLGLAVAPQHLTDSQLVTLIEALDAAGPATMAAAAAMAAPDPSTEATAETGATAYAAALAALPSPRGVVRATAAAPDGADARGPDVLQPLRINILGPVEVTGVIADGPLGDKQVELLAYLALHGKATAHQLDDALWPGRRVDRLTRNSFIYRTRSHVGRAQLPVKEHAHYALAEHVRTDWDDFTRLANRGLRAGPAGAADLHAALDLVRERPFLGIDPRTYTWADALIQEITTAVADVAHCLAGLLADTGDHIAAARAAAIGLLVEPASDQLHQDALDAALARHDVDEARWLSERHEALLEALDSDGG